MAENRIRIQRKEEDLYRINIADDGTEIVFDLADIGLPFKCQRAFQKVEKNQQVAMGKVKAIEKRGTDLNAGKNGLFTRLESEILQIYTEMFEKNREIMDEFFGCPGAMQLLFGDSNYMDMYDDLFEQFEPHFEKMHLNVDSIKERLQKKYAKRKTDVLS